MAPALVAMGKELGNDYPVSALAIGPEAAEILEKKSFYYQQSHQNDALGCRVALEVTNEIKRKELISRSDTLGMKLIGS